MSPGSFAAAQQRIAARQLARQHEAQSDQVARQRSLTSISSTLSRLPYPLKRSPELLSSLWTTITNPDGTQPTIRVSQVDAELLDAELLTLLKSQVGDALKYFNQHVQDDYSQEILLALRAILFKLSIWDNDASYGAALQGLRYTDARQLSSSSSVIGSTSGSLGPLAKPTPIQKSLYGGITVLGRYAWDKYSDYLLDAESSYPGSSSSNTDTLRTLSLITTRLSTLHSLASFTSFLVFLINGRYRTLTDRLLHLRLVSPNAQTHREVSFEYLNRQLVWHAFTEFLLFLLPLVGISRWRRWLARAWRKAKRALSTDPASSTIEPEEKKGPLSFLPERTCAICYQEQNPAGVTEAEVLGANTQAGGGITGSVSTDIVNPYETMECECIYCFVCIASKIEAEEGSGWSCLRCGETVLRCRPWRADVLVEPVKGAKGQGKTVGFVERTRNEEADGDEKEDDAVPADLESELGASRWEDAGREFDS